MKRVFFFLGLFALAFGVTLVVVRGGRTPGSSAGLSPDDLQTAQVFLEGQRAELAAVGEAAAVTLRLSAPQVRLLLLGAAVESSERLVAQLRSLDVDLSDGRLALKVAFDLGALGESELALPELGALTRVVEAARALAERDVPLYLSATPRAEGGKLALSLDDLEVRLGPLPVPVAELASSKSREAVSDALSLGLPGFEVEQARVEGGELILQARRSGS